MGEIGAGMDGWVDGWTDRQTVLERGLETLPNQEWKEENRTKKGSNNISLVGGRLEHSG